MSAVVGIDLSTKALDLVKLQEDSNAAEWVRCELHGSNAWERTLRVRDALLAPAAARPIRAGHPREVHIPNRVLGQGEPDRAVIRDDLSDGVIASCRDDLSDADEVGSALTANVDLDPVTDVVLERHHPIVTESDDVSYVACGICGNCWGCDCGSASWWDDVLLVAIEAPYGHGSDLLNRVVGAIVSALPAHLRVPHRCWVVRPDEWKNGLGLKGKPTVHDLGSIAPGALLERADIDRTHLQHGYDAYALAYWAREENSRALASASALSPGGESSNTGEQSADKSVGAPDGGAA